MRVNNNNNRLLICLLDCLPTAIPDNSQEFRTSYVNCGDDDDDDSKIIIIIIVTQKINFTLEHGM